MKKKNWLPRLLVAMIVSLIVAYPLFGCMKTEKVSTAQEAESKETMQDTKEPIKEEEVPVQDPEKKPEEKEATDETASPVIRDGFIYALLKGVDWDKGLLKIEQLEGGPNEPQVGEEIELAADYRAARSVLIRKPDTEVEYHQSMKLGQIPKGSEIGIMIKDSKADKIFFQQYIDAQMQSERIETAAGESFIYAILKGVDRQNGIITIEQLLSGPSDKQVGDTLPLASEYRVQLIVVERMQGQETEYVKDIRLEEIGIQEEIGIILTPEERVRAIVFALSVE